MMESLQKIIEKPIVVHQPNVEESTVSRNKRNNLSKVSEGSSSIKESINQIEEKDADDIEDEIGEVRA